MFFDKSNVSSYAIYIGSGSAAAVVKGNVSESAVSITSELAAETIKEAPWMYESFPNLVEQGILIVKNGHIYIYGLSMLELFSITAITVTLGITISKFVMDVITFKRNSRK